MDREWRQPAAARQAIRICDVAPALRPGGRALAGHAVRCAAILARGPSPLGSPPGRRPTSARGCSSGPSCATWRSGRSRRRLAGAGDPAQAVGLLVSVYPGNYHGLLGRDGRAMEHYQAAVACEGLPVGTIQPLVIYRKRGDGRSGDD